MLSQPGMAVNANLDSEREPGRKPNVNQAQFMVKEIEVQDALLSSRPHEAGTILTVLESETWTALHAAENTDESFVDRTFAQDFVDDRFLAVKSLKELVWSAGLLRQPLRVLDKRLGLLLGKRHEFAAWNSEYVIDDTLEGLPSRNRQVACEANSVKTGEHRDDQAGELGDEARQYPHGVLLQSGWLRHHHCGGRTPVLLLLFGCGRRQR